MHPALRKSKLAGILVVCAAFAVVPAEARAHGGHGGGHHGGYHGHYHGGGGSSRGRYAAVSSATSNRLFEPPPPIIADDLPAARLHRYLGRLFGHGAW
jgi:hypothetical protein